MNKPICILCGSNDITILESINTRYLAALYKKRAHVNVESFFNGDRIEYCNCKKCELKFYWPLQIGDGKFYDELQQYNGYYLKEKAEFTEAAKFIKKEDSVLEVGCGEGLFQNYIEYKSYTGLEFSDEAINKARVKGIDVIKQNLEEHAKQNLEKYDVVCYFQVLEHVENPKDFIQNSIVCLKPGGKLILAVPSEDSFIAQAVNCYLNMPPHHASRWPDTTLRKLGELFHLTLIQLYHEPLHQRHRFFYVKTKIYHVLNSFYKIKYKLIDISMANSFLYAVTWGLSFLLTPFFTNKNIEGQSVMAVYTKN